MNCSDYRVSIVAGRGRFDAIVGKVAKLCVLGYCIPMRGLVACALALLLLATAGCVSVPVQAMSNARQALQTAQKAGAVRYAPALYAEATRWLGDAEFALRGDDYSRARSSALKAARVARKAAAVARTAARTAGTAPAPVPGTDHIPVGQFLHSKSGW